VRAGVDIGGTKTDAVLLDEGGGVLHRLRVPTGFGPAGVVESAVTAVQGLAERCGAPAAAFDSIGVGIPGRVDSGTGRVDHAVNLGLEGLELGAALALRIAAPVRVENDVNAAAVGAFQRLDGVRSMAYLNIGTGLAAGLVLDGRLHRGAHGTAGEIGHIAVDPAGELCRCGQRGCLETLASGSAIARAWPSLSPRPVKELFDAAAAGSARAAEVRDALVAGVAAAVRVLVLTVDVERVVLGGGVSSLGDRLLAAVRASLEAGASASAFLGSLDLPSRVSTVPDGYPAAAVGAALIGDDRPVDAVEVAAGAVR